MKTFTYALAVKGKYDRGQKILSWHTFMPSSHLNKVCSCNGLIFLKSEY